MKRSWILSGVLIAMGMQAHADVYSYKGVELVCSVSATRQEVGVREQGIGSYIQGFGFQLFQSNTYDPRLTAFATGPNLESTNMIRAGGIPNLKAQQNWTVMQDIDGVNTQFSIPGVQPIPVSFVMDRARGGMRGHFSMTWSWALAQSILVGLGEKQIPDFSTDQPVVSWTDPKANHVFASSGGRWVQDANHLGQKQLYQEEISRDTVQIHYPADRHNGLSYHITVSCE